MPEIVHSRAATCLAARRLVLTVAAATLFVPAFASAAGTRASSDALEPLLPGSLSNQLSCDAGCEQDASNPEYLKPVVTLRHEGRADSPGKQSAVDTSVLID
jgi:hypothetical protein